MSPRLRLLLEGLLDPLVEDRMTAQQAQRVLRGEDRGAETRGDRASRGSRCVRLRACAHRGCRIGCREEMHVSMAGGGGGRVALQLFS